jgi:monoamine oxidase
MVPDPGYLEGAIESGHRVALKVTQALPSIDAV